VVAGQEKWKALLKERFPTETSAIDTFFELLDQVTRFQGRQ
jgi:hypothetical protein